MGKTKIHISSYNLQYHSSLTSSLKLFKVLLGEKKFYPD